MGNADKTSSLFSNSSWTTISDDDSCSRSSGPWMKCPHGVFRRPSLTGGKPAKTQGIKTKTCRRNRKVPKEPAPAAPAPKKVLNEQEKHKHLVDNFVLGVDYDISTPPLSAVQTAINSDMENVEIKFDNEEVKPKVAKGKTKGPQVRKNKRGGKTKVKRGRTRHRRRRGSDDESDDDYDRGGRTRPRRRKKRRGGKTRATTSRDDEEDELERGGRTRIQKKKPAGKTKSRDPDELEEEEDRPKGKGKKKDSDEDEIADGDVKKKVEKINQLDKEAEELLQKIQKLKELAKTSSSASESKGKDADLLSEVTNVGMLVKAGQEKFVQQKGRLEPEPPVKGKKSSVEESTDQKKSESAPVEKVVEEAKKKSEKSTDSTSEDIAKVKKMIKKKKKATAKKGAKKAGHSVSSESTESETVPKKQAAEVQRPKGSEADAAQKKSPLKAEDVAKKEAVALKSSTSTSSNDTVSAKGKSTSPEELEESEETDGVEEGDDE